MKQQLNIGQVIGLILQIESETNIPCLSYGLYDKKNHEYITQENMRASYDYYDAFENKTRFKYLHDTDMQENAVVYLLKHHGQLYFPMLKRGTQKAFTAQFDMNKLLEVYGNKSEITPSTYYKDSFCFYNKNQCAGQLSFNFN